MSHSYKNRPQQPSTKSPVQQHHAQDADLNRLMARHAAGPGRYGAPVGNPNATRQPRFLDLSDSRSYHEKLNVVTQIDTMFNRLPSRLRTRFKNRPELLMQFAEDPANAREAVKLGLIDDPQVIQAVYEAEEARDLEREAEKAGESDKAPKAGDEAQPKHTHRKGGKAPEGD